MDFTFTPEQETFRNELRSFLSSALPQGWATAGYQEPDTLEDVVAFGRAWQRKLAEAGYVGVNWPREWGGRGMGLIEQIIVEEEMARAKAPLPINLAGITMGGPVVMAHGTSEQKRRFIPKILNADEIWCQGFSEPGAGSDLASVRTKAIIEGDEFVISGQKVWTSFAQYSDWCMLLARTDSSAPKHRGISFILVDMHSPGITVRPLRQMSGEEGFNELFFDNVRVPRENLMGRLNQGWQVAITCLMHERTTLTFTRQLQSRIAFEELLEFARTPSPDGKSRSKDPIYRQRLAQLFVDSECLRFTFYRNLTQVLRTGQPGPEGSIEKLFWSEMYQRMLETAVEMQGPYANLMKGSPYAQADGRFQFLHLYSRGRTIAAGSSEIQRNIIAERVLKMPKGN
jgi:alkylation response protein AidB-like acyl-CoA dehydrogenase